MEFSKKTLASTLVMYLTMFIFLTSLSVSLAIYLLEGAYHKKEYRNKAEEFISHLSKSLEMPLWTLDDENIKRICEVFFATYYLSELHITNEEGETIFSATKEGLATDFFKEVSVEHSNKTIGKIVAGFTYEVITKEHKRFFIAQQISLVIIFLSLAIMVYLWMKKNIHTPFEQFLSWFQEIAKGNYEIPAVELPFVELSLMSSEIMQMAKKIQEREEALLELGDKLKRKAQEKEELFRKLEESIARFDTIMSNAVDGIIIFKEDGKISYMNKTVERLFGYTKEELLEKVVCHLFPEKDREILASLAKEDSLKTHVLEMKGIRKDKTTIPLEVSLAKVPIKEGGEDRIILILRDITPRKILEKEKEEALKQLMRLQKLEALGTLASGVAHDFNNILMIIMGFTDLAKSMVTSDSPIKEYLDQISNASQRAKSLINQINSIARPQISEKVVFNPSSLIKEIIKFLRATIPSSIEIKQSISSQDIFIEGDPSQIHQVIMNLCINGVHAMEHSKEKVLTVEMEKVNLQEPLPCYFGNLQPGTYVRISVSDTGEGIPEEILPRIFDPYFTTKTPDKGTGLGLAIVRSIIESHCGNIEVATTLGEGTTFHVYIPCNFRCVVESIDYRTSIFPELKTQKHIVFVDDEPILTELVQKALSSRGYKVVAFNDPVKALEYIKSHCQKIDLLISDITMPHLQGNQLAQLAKNLRKDLAIILCTGYAGTISKDQLEELEIKALMFKPFTVDDLVREIDKIFEEA